MNIVTRDTWKTTPENGNTYAAHKLTLADKINSLAILLKTNLIEEGEQVITGTAGYAILLCHPWFCVADSDNTGKFQVVDGQAYIGKLFHRPVFFTNNAEDVNKILLKNDSGTAAEITIID